jgi:SAM-dependent methyltransferase
MMSADSLLKGLFSAGRQRNSMQHQLPGIEAIFQLAALWGAKCLRGRMQRSAGNEAAFYSDFFTDEDEDTFGWDPRARLRQQTVKYALNSRIPTGGKILDVGCGLGEVLAALIDDYTCFGVDFAETNVRRARRRLGAGATITQGSAFAIPFENGSMDAVMCLEVLEHLSDDRAALVELVRVLRPGGILIIAVPYTYYWPAYLRLMGHYRHYTRDSLSELLGSVGCQVVDYLPNYPRWHQRFTRGFIRIRALHIISRRLKGGGSGLREFSLMPGGRPEIERLDRRLTSQRERDGALPYSELPTSTFVVAGRISEANTC